VLDNSWVTEQVEASQERLNSMELVCQNNNNSNVKDNDDELELFFKQTLT
jgi:hypothetical protein